MRNRHGLAGVQLVSLDVGNTLLTSAEPGLATLVAKAAQPCSRLDEAIALLHTRETTQALVDDICNDLAIKPIDLLSYRPPEPLVLQGVVEGLALLRALHIRIVTLSNVASIDAVPIPSIISDHLDAQYQSFKVGAAKPDLAAFGSMLRAEKVAPHASIHIGDSWRCDALGALSAGMTAIWIAPFAATQVPPSQEGLIVVQSFSEAVEILLQELANE